MSTSSSAKRGQFWRADWFVAVLIVMAVVILNQATDVISTLERRFYDFGSTSSGRQPSDRIAIIAIDDQSIANIGRWPWSRSVHAQLIDQLPSGARPGLVSLAGSEDTPPARTIGYYSDRLDHVAVATLSRSNRRLFIELEADALHTNVAGYIFNER